MDTKKKGRKMSSEMHEEAPQNSRKVESNPISHSKTGKKTYKPLYLD